MEDDARLLDSLLERASEYGKTSLIVRFFLYNRIKKLVGNYFIKIVLK
jgi:hypothetical protein